VLAMLAKFKKKSTSELVYGERLEKLLVYLRVFFHAAEFK